MNKLVLGVSGIGAAVTMAVLGAAHANAYVPDVTGEVYGKAVAILKSQGYKPIFGGSIGSDLPQSQCIVSDQSSMTNGSQRLRLDCKLQPGQEKPGAPNTHSLVPPGGSIPSAEGTEGAEGGGAPSRPTPGAGTVTVTPVPVG